MQNVQGQGRDSRALNERRQTGTTWVYKKRRDKVAGSAIGVCVRSMTCRVRTYDWTEIETEKLKIMWDVSIQTDHVFEHRRPDIVVYTVLYW